MTGGDGLDEITLDGPTIVRMVERAEWNRHAGGRRTSGFCRQDAGSLVVRDAEESARRLIQIFEGERGPARDYVIANTAAACTSRLGARCSRELRELARRSILGLRRGCSSDCGSWRGPIRACTRRQGLKRGEV